MAVNPGERIILARAALDANKMLLQVLDEKVAALKAAAAITEDQREESGSHPYFYSVVGADDEPGIRLSDGPGSTAQPGRSYVGRIEIQEDSPFVWTHIMTSIRAPDANVPSFFGTFFGGDGAGVTASGPGALRLGFTEQGSGHNLFQAEILSPGTASASAAGLDADQGANLIGRLPLATTLNTLGVYDTESTFGGQFDGIPIGLGPNFPYPLTNEVVLPNSGVIEVRAQTGLTETPDPSDPWRVYVTLMGYKIFGE